MNMPIYDKLEKLKENGSYPFHMPGHKRNFHDIFENENPFSIDITEITGYDDLHQPEGIIRNVMDRIKEIYGTEESFLLINSSTGGILSAISTVCSIGDKILVARNCHKSVYHGIQLLGLNPVYVYPEVDKHGICLGIQAWQIEEIMQREKDIQCAVIVSPTYEGRVSDIFEISKILHENNVSLIVDEAHGAHFIYHDAFPESAVHLGADIVIQSLHKTLPSLTQTGLLHLCSDRISKSRIQEKLSVFQSSSPSYLLMASIDGCIHKCITEKESFQQYTELVNNFRKDMKNLKYLKLADTDDIGKLVILTEGSSISGQELFQKLQKKYHIELEMAEISYVIAMTSICDTAEGFSKLFFALREIDDELHQSSKMYNNQNLLKSRMLMTPEEAGRKEKRSVILEQAKGYPGADFVYLYPPGIPVIVPGEIIEIEHIERIKQYRENHMKVVGISYDKINIIDERI